MEIKQNINKPSLIKTLIIPTALGAGFIRIAIDFLAKVLETGPLFYYGSFFLSFVLEIFLIIYITKKFKKENKSLNVQEGLKIAVATMVLIGLMFAIYSLGYNKYINPEFQSEMAVQWGELFGQGDAVREEVAKNESKNSPLGIFYVMLQFSFLGFVIGMVVSSILKTRENLN